MDVDWATQILAEALDEDSEGIQDALPAVYEELRSIAAGYLWRERFDESLGPTSLAHEAYLRLRDWDRVEWKSRSHFLAAAAKTMRRLLVEKARRRLTQKRTGLRTELDSEEIPDDSEVNWDDMIALDSALTRLQSEQPRCASVIEMLYFGGMTTTEAGKLLGVARRTVERDWEFSRAWILREMTRERPLSQPMDGEG